MSGEDAPVTPAATTTPATTTPPATTPAAPAEPKPATTVLSGDTAGKPAAETTTAPAKADAVADWRAGMTGGDEKLSKLVDRYTSPRAVAEALLASRQAISEGKVKATLSADATPEQISAYRKDNGIPEKPEGYLEKLPDGMVIGETDKPLVGKFAEAMHALNAPPQMVHAALNSYYAIQAAQADRIADANLAARDNVMQSLTEEWGGPEYRSNLTAIKNMLGTMPQEAQELLHNVRDQNGVHLFNHPTMIRAFAQLARELNPASTVVQASDGDVGKALTTELDQIEKVMKTDYQAYYRDKKMVARYGELLAAREKMKARA